MVTTFKKKLKNVRLQSKLENLFRIPVDLSVGVLLGIVGQVIKVRSVVCIEAKAEARLGTSHIRISGVRPSLGLVAHMVNLVINISSNCYGYFGHSSRSCGGRKHESYIKLVTENTRQVSNREKMLTSFHEWKALTNDQWILNTIQGYEIEFEAEPFQLKIPNQIRFSAEEEKLVDKEVSSLLSEGAIIACFHEPHELISNIFLVPKPNGKFRPVINLKKLNEFFVYEHFKQETFPFVLEVVQKNEFFTNLDLRSAYFSIPIHPDYQKFLKFTWKGMLYKFISLCFGLSSSPKVFTKVLKPVFALFRSLGMRCSYYVDDSINMHWEKQVCEANAHFMYNKLDSLGYVINDEKSVLIASQRIKYFGFILDSVLFMVFLPDEKVQKIEGMATYLLGAKVIKIRELVSFIGLLINAFHAVLETPLHYRTLEREKVKNLGISGDYNSKILSTEAKFQISWWADNIRSKNGKKIRPDPISEWIQTDASLLGWGSFWVGKSISSGGIWSVEQNGLHISPIWNCWQFSTH